MNTTRTSAREPDHHRISTVSPVPHPWTIRAAVRKEIRVAFKSSLAGHKREALLEDEFECETILHMADYRREFKLTCEWFVTFINEFADETINRKQIQLLHFTRGS